MKSNKKIRFTVRELTTAALFTALTAVFSQVMIPIGAVPINLCTLAVFLTAALLPLKGAAASIASFILLGAAGVPVFAGFSGGIGKIFGPTGGYILAYLPAVLIIGALLKKFGRTKVSLSLSMLAGLVLIYLCGTLWYMFVSKSAEGFYSALTACVLPFIPWDILKIAAAVVLSLRLQKILTFNG